jgi:hypothetical protein
VSERLGGKFDRINSSYVDLIQSVISPSYNHVYMAFGYNEESGKTVDDMTCSLLWTCRIEGAVHKRKLVAKGRIAAAFNMGGLHMSFSKENAQGLLLNTLHRLKGAQV